MTVSSDIESKTPLISVVVPVYNTEPYLEECLDSLLNQDHENLEIICVDDCSPDNSIDILQKYGQSDPRVTTLRHEVNQGLGPARNTGIKAANGGLIGFVDSDDWIEPEMYSKLLELMQTSGADITQCSAARISDGRNIGSYPESNGVRTSFTMHSMFGEAPKFVGAAWNKLYRKSLFIDNDIFYPAILFEDVATTPRLLQCASAVASLSESYLNYRYRDDSIVNDVRPDKIIARLDGLFEGAMILARFFTARKVASLEFILNYRAYLMPQIHRNLRLAAEIDPSGEALESALSTLESYLLGEDERIRYFFPDRVRMIQRLRIETRTPL
ncbi:glycosyltransferase family 2 protein [Pseudooceanicola sp. C21-150M6]|uniref:glycosyltransferase family 2 protein n=1 Tax=Pseudooceanicola sp. C21-150M6 TaxID=3434355 RepID=UPI003D7F8BAA